MSSDKTSPEAGNAVRREADRAEKGSAMAMIAAETKAVNEKTARLRALRLKSEKASDEPTAPAKEKAPARRRSTKAKPA